MERLTKVMNCDDGSKLYDFSNDIVNEYKEHSERVKLAIKKLANYEDADEQGLLAFAKAIKIVKGNVLDTGKGDNGILLDLKQYDREIRNKAIDEFLGKCISGVQNGELYDFVKWNNWNDCVCEWFEEIAEQLKESDLNE